MVQAIVEKAERDLLSPSLQRIYVATRNLDLVLEFWFAGCTQAEASECAAAAIREALAATTGTDGKQG